MQITGHLDSFHSEKEIITTSINTVSWHLHHYHSQSPVYAKPFYTHPEV